MAKVAILQKLANTKIDCNQSKEMLGKIIKQEFDKEKDIMEKFAIWRTGGIRFNSTPIQDVAKELERIYHCKVIFSGNKPYDNLITGIHERATLKDVLNSIEYVTGIRYKYQNNTVILYNN